jgi:DNA-binding Lrp family transcriptional regulator
LIAYVLVKVEPGKENVVAREIVKAKEVREAAWTYGFCDILLKAEAASINELDKIVFNRIRKTPGVLSTETIIVSPIPIYASRPASKTETKRARAKRKARSQR